MRKFFNIINIVFFCLLISAQQASAQAIKFDISKSLGKITTTVSGWLETAKKQMDQAATLQTMIAYGKGAVETAKKIKELEGGIGAAISETEALAEGSIGSVNGGLQSIQSEASSIGSKSPSQMEDAQKLLELKAQKTMLESERDEAIAAAQDEVNGKKALAEENIAKLQDMISWEPDKKLEYESQIAYYQGEITNYEKELDKTTSTIQQQYQSEISAIDKQISELRDKAVSEAGKAAEEKLGSVLGGGDEETTAAMNEMIKNNFLAADEEEIVENITPRKVYRKLTAAKDTVAAFNNAWRVKKSRYENDKKAQKLQEEVSQMEGSSSALGMNTKIKVENINALLEYARMMVQDLKMRTANDINNLTNNWKLNRYDKDVTEFNLDDYIFDGKSKSEAVIELAESVKEKGIEQTASEYLNGDEEEEDTGTDDNNSGEEALSAVRSELKGARAGSGNYEGVDESGVQDITPVNVNEELNEARSKASGN